MRNALSSASYTLGLLAPVAGFDNGGLTTLTEELRQIMRSIDGRLDPKSAQQLHALNEQLVGYTGIIAESVRRGLSITLRILDYAQTSAIIPGDVACSLSDVVDEVLASMRGHLQERDIACHVRAASGAQAYVSHDHAFAIVRNLVANASEAMQDNASNQPRALHVTIAFEGEAQVALQVEDTGNGIADHLKDKLFHPFFTTKGSNGTGLGLAFSRRIAAIYGGDVKLSNVAHRGAAFTLTLPRR